MRFETQIAFGDQFFTVFFFFFKKQKKVRNGSNGNIHCVQNENEIKQS